MIGLIVSVGIMLFTLLITKGLAIMANNEIEGAGAIMATSGIAAWSNGVSVMGNTAQMIAPIFITIFFVKEFNDRTIRNKLIIGYSRSQIFFSIIICHLVISFVFLFATSLVGLIAGTILFGLGTTLTGDVFLLLLIGFILQFILSYVLMGLCIIVSINRQSIALGIVLPIAIGFVISILGSVAIMGINAGFTKVMSFTNFYQSMELQEFVSTEQLFIQNTIEFTNDLGETTKIIYIPMVPIARILIMSPIVIAIELILGYFRFKRIQFK